LREFTIASSLFLGILLPGGALVFLVILAIRLYNSLVQAQARTRESWAGIVAQLKRRTDLVPNLVSNVKSYSAHELQLLDEVAQRRAEVARAPGPATAGQADLALSAALERLIAVAESYPNLKASDNFLELQQELADVEEKIAYARRFYNQCAQEYNIRVQSVPTLYVARLCRFKPVEYFQAEATEKNGPVSSMTK
jgi:LemA protein